MEVTICTSTKWLDAQNCGLKYEPISKTMERTYSTPLHVFLRIEYNGEKKVVDIDLRDRTLSIDGKSVPYDTLPDYDKSVLDGFTEMMIMDSESVLSIDAPHSVLTSFKEKEKKLESYSDVREYHLYIHSGEYIPPAYAELLMKEFRSIAEEFDRSYSIVFLSVVGFLMKFNLHSGSITLYHRKLAMVMPEPDGSMEDIPDNLADCCFFSLLIGVPVPDCNLYDMVPMPFSWNVDLE